MLIGGTILGPGTIFLMLVGAFVAAFRIDNWSSFIYNMVPILFFMLICFVTKSEVQVWISNTTCSSGSFLSQNTSFFSSWSRKSYRQPTLW